MSFGVILPYVDSLYSQDHSRHHTSSDELLLPLPPQQTTAQPTALKTNPQFDPSNFVSVPKIPQRLRPNLPSSPRVLSDLGDGNLYEATYSGVAVYELQLGGHSVMRRKDDSWINVTHILKVAGVEKGRRTKILEREVHGEPHEKIQGGFGKYQGTWYTLLMKDPFKQRN
jgi:hypothetical protein